MEAYLHQTQAEPTGSGSVGLEPSRLGMAVSYSLRFHEAAPGCSRRGMNALLCLLALEAGYTHFSGWIRPNLSYTAGAVTLVRFS